MNGAAIVAVDLAPGTEAFVDAAVAWVSRFGLRLDLRTVHGLPLPLEPLAATGEFPSITAEWTAFHEVAHARLSALAARVPEPLRGDWKVLVGLPAPELAEASAEADLLVLGARSHGGLAHLLLGAISEWMVRRSAAPVLVLHADDPPASPVGPVRTLFPIDPNAPSARAIEVARRWVGADLEPCLVAVVEPDASVGDAWDALRLVARGTGLPPETRKEVVDRGQIHLGDRVAAVARDLGAGLVALPTHQRTGLVDRFLVGSVAERVARTAHCPVLTVGPA